MANITQQQSQQSGSDGSQSTGSKSSNGNTNRTANTTRSENRTISPSTVTRTAKANSKSQVTTEDHAFTITFTVPLDGAVPCEPIAI